MMKVLEAGERCLKSLKKRILINEEIKQVIFHGKLKTFKTTYVHSKTLALLFVEFLFLGCVSGVFYFPH